MNVLVLDDGIDVHNEDLFANARRVGYEPPGGRMVFQFSRLVKSVAGIEFALDGYGPAPPEPGTVHVTRFSSNADPADLPPILLSEIVCDLRAMMACGDPFRRDVETRI